MGPQRQSPSNLSRSNPSERDLRTRRAGAAYQGGLEAVLAILIGAGLGYWADSYFGTSPVWFLVGFFFGFGAFVLRLIRLGRQLQQQAGEPPAPNREGD